MFFRNWSVCKRLLSTIKRARGIVLFKKISIGLLFLSAASGIQLSKQIFLSKNLSPEAFSIWGLSNLVASLFSGLGSLGGLSYATHLMSKLVQSEKNELDNNIENALFSLYIYLAPLSLFVIFLLLGIRDNFFQYAVYAFTFSVFVIVNLACSQINSTQYSFRQLIKGIISFSIIFLLVILRFDIVHVLIADSIALLFISFYIEKLSFVSPRKIFRVLIFNKKFFIEYSFSIFLSIGSLYVGRAISSNVLNPYELGIYFFCLILVGIGDQIQSMVAVLLQPIISKASLNCGEEKYLSSFIMYWLIMVAICAILACLLYILFPYIIIFFPKYLKLSDFIIPSLFLMVSRATNIWPIVLTLQGKPHLINKIQLVTIFMLLIGATFSKFLLSLQGVTWVSLMLLIEAFALLVSPFFIIWKGL